MREVNSRHTRRAAGKLIKFQQHTVNAGVVSWLAWRTEQRDMSSSRVLARGNIVIKIFTYLLTLQPPDEVIFSHFMPCPRNLEDPFLS